MEQAKILAAESRIKTKIVYIPVRVPVGTLFTILNEVPVVIGQVIPFAVQISIVYGSPLAPESSKTRKTNWEPGSMVPVVSVPLTVIRRDELETGGSG